VRARAAVVLARLEVLVNVRILSAEALGTFVLMVGGVGSAVLAGGDIGFHGVAIAFGFSLLIMAYAIGPISGCHINPAVTLGMIMAGKTKSTDALAYIVGQLIGAAVGGLAIFAIANGVDGFDATNNFCANGFDDFSPGGYNLFATAVAEIILTALLVIVVVGTTRTDFVPGFGPIAAGLTLALIHLISIPVDNTSVNPARSFGAALFAGSDALEQLWAFIVFPLIGGALGVIVTRFVVGAPKPAL
jgi:aquaporin Z